MRWLLRIFLMGMSMVLLIVLLGALLFLQSDPLLEDAIPPSSQDVANTRQLVHEIRAASAAQDSADARLRTDAEDINGAIRLGAQFIDGFRGRITVDGLDVLGEASIPLPSWRGSRWLNISGRIPEFQSGITLSKLTVGSIDLPPELFLSIARIGANLVMGNRFGDKILQAASAMEINGDQLSFHIELDDLGKNGVIRSVFGILRGRQMPYPDEIEAYHFLIRAAMADGTLEQTGSFLPYIRFTLAAALAQSTTETLPNAYTAAIFGLAKVCGARDFAMIVGRLAFTKLEAAREWSTTCNDVTLNGRIDSRRHFVTAAALQAASNTGVSVSIGEFKELYDSISGAGGFDFTDMAANLSGIRLSDILMTTSHEAWSEMLDHIKEENDVIVPFDDIPQIMTEAAFKARFSDVESQEYKAILGQIGRQIDALGLYRPD